jgi:ribonuclease HI
MPYYAVANGRKQGIFNTWDECKEQVYQFAGARYKKFDTVQAAQQFIDEKSTRKSYVRVETKSTTEKRKFSAQGSDSNNAVNSKSIRIEVSKPLNSSTIIGKFLQISPFCFDQRIA